MKGYSKVSIDVAAKAQENFKTWHQQAEELFDELVDRYYTKYYTNGNFLTRWLYKKKTPGQFLLKDIGFCEPYSYVLYKVCDTQTELTTLSGWENCYREQDKCKAIKALLNASSGDKLLLDQELCAFIEKWKKE